MRYVALLRGINVGKSIQVPMKDLKQIFENIGYTNVITYLNSGNVVFDSINNKNEVSQKIHTELEIIYEKSIPTLIKTSDEIELIKCSIPIEWENDKTQQTYIAYLFEDVARPDLIDELPIKRQFIDIRYAHDAIIWNIKREYYNKSQINKIINHPAYLRMTTRNVNTVRKLAELCKVN